MRSPCSIPLALSEAATASEDDASDDGCAPKPIVLAGADAGTFAIPDLRNTLPGTLTVAPTEYYEGFFVAAIRKKERTRGKR